MTIPADGVGSTMRPLHQAKNSIIKKDGDARYKPKP